MIHYSLADVLGIGPLFTFEGKEYTLEPLDVERQAIFSHKLRQRNYEEALRSEEFLPPKAAADAITAVRRDAAAGEFDFHGQTCLRALMSRWGYHESLKLALVKYPDIDDAFVDRLLDTLYQAGADLKAKGEGYRLDPKSMAVVKKEPT